jgi:hypothetical protein
MLCNSEFGNQQRSQRLRISALEIQQETRSGAGHIVSVNGCEVSIEVVMSVLGRITEIRRYVIPGAGSQQPSPGRRISAPEIEHEIRSGAGHIFSVNCYELSVDVVINLSRFPYQFERVGDRPVVAAHRTSLISIDARPVCNPE